MMIRIMTSEMKETYPSSKPHPAVPESLRMPGQYNARLEDEAASNTRYGHIP
jgi:hypothetical protein